MRRTTLVTLTAAMLFTVGAVGQQEPTLVDLRLEPARTERNAGLFEAASTNDFYTFDALYRRAPAAEYAELHRLWTWSMADPIGAFYGAEGHARLSRAYPEFGAYIEEYTIVDSNGNVFYPTAETRRFLVSQAVMGILARGVEEPVRVAAVQRQREVAPATTPAPRGQAEIVAAQPEVAPVGTPVPQRETEIVVVQPEVAPVRTTAPQRQPEVAPVATMAPQRLREGAAVVVGEGERVRGPLRRAEAARGALSRSLLLIIAGLLGIGMITLMLHAPREEQEPRPTR